jgi:methylmalonyl-CoA mutase C-terminal domain/subunit
VRYLLDQAGAADIVVVAGGVIPQEDIPALVEAGIARVFLSGTSIAEIARYLEGLIVLDEAAAPDGATVA